MRSSALTIAAAVAGYLAIEAFLLLLLAKETGLHEMLFVVSTAIMLAAFFYGGPRTARRALSIVGWIIASPAFMGWVLATLLSAIQKSGAIFGDFVEVALPIVILISAPCIPAYFSWRNIRRNVPAEADCWLSDRERYGPHGVLRRSRLKRWSLWLPSVIVLATLLFWTPLQAVIDRFHDFRPGNLAGCRIKVPLSWTPMWTYERHGHYLTLMRFRQLASCALTLSQRQPIISGMTFASGSDPDPNQNVNALMQRDRQYASDFLMHPLSGNSIAATCWQYKLKGRHYYPEGELWLATCAANDGRFEARFGGDRDDLDSFYEIVSSAEVRK